MRIDVEKMINELRASGENAEKYLRFQRQANIGGMLAGIAHKFNNVLGGILGYAQLLKEELPVDSDSYRKATVIETAAKRASKLILQLHLFASQNKPFRKKSVDPKELIGEAIGIAANGINPNIKVVTELAHEPYSALCDFQSISLVLLTLLLNAREAMPRGGELTIRTGIDSVEDKDFVVFGISDTGEGISEEHLPKVCQPFFTTRKKGTVSGLGLTIAKDLVEAHSGDLLIHSVVNHGTSVRILIPATTSSPESEKPPLHEVASNAAPSSGLVMVVDDEQELRDLAKSIFERKGFEVILADSGESAIQLFNENAANIRLVLLDMILPGPNGNQVYREIKRSNRHPKIILTSGLSKDSSVLEFEEGENEYFFPKPWDLPELIASVGRLLQSEES